MDYIYIIFNFISEITSDGWIALLGIIVGFSGVYKTIKNSEEQFKEDKRISIKPYLDIKLKNSTIDVCSLGFFKINEFKNRVLDDLDDIVIEITNLGQGNCLDCKLIEIRIDGKKVNDEDRYIGNLKVDENMLRQITFNTWYGDVLDQLKTYIGKNLNDCPNEFEDMIYRHFVNEIEMEFEYKDVLENKYRKTIPIDVFIIFIIYLGHSPHFKVENIVFNTVSYEVNGNLITEKSI